MKQLRCEHVGLDDCVVDAASGEDVIKKAIEHMWEYHDINTFRHESENQGKDTDFLITSPFTILNNQISRLNV